MRSSDNPSASPPPSGVPRSKKLRDAVHKDIRLSEGELRTIDTPQMQRLRGIRQLGAAYYVYPGAQHTRFEHSVGTCWMAKQIVAHVEAAGAFGGEGIQETDR